MLRGLERIDEICDVMVASIDLRDRSRFSAPVLDPKVQGKAFNSPIDMFNLTTMETYEVSDIDRNAHEV